MVKMTSIVVRLNDAQVAHVINATKERIIALLDEAYDEKFDEFRGEYNKPMYTEEWAFLDGIKFATRLIRGED